MRAISVIPSRKEVAEIDHPEPELCAPSHVKIRTVEVGVCGTDREICRFDYGQPPEGDEHLVLGHEALGEVIEVGDGVETFQEGDLVTPSVRRPCPDPGCRPCQDQLQDYCQTWAFTERGIHQSHGYMTERFVEDERFLFPVDPELADIAVLTEPLTIAEKGISSAFALQQRLPWLRSSAPDHRPGEGMNAVVIGAGPIGILGAMALKARGFHTVAYSRSPAPNPKADLLSDIGVPYYSIHDYSAADLSEDIGGIDLVYEAVGLPEVSFQVLEALGVNGIFIFTGIPGAPRSGEPDAVAVPGNSIMRNVVLKNQIIVGTVNANAAAFQDALRDLARFHQLWPEAIRRVISQRHAPEAYRSLLLDRATGIKNVISFA